MYMQKLIIEVPLHVLFQVRLQTMPRPAPGQNPLYKGTWDCAMQTVRKEVRTYCVALSL